jgi:LysR family transcriptional regulator, glycine cleavage system transcriptional activator
MRLAAEQLFTVHSPKLLAGRQRLANPSELLKFPLLHLEDRKAFEVAGIVDAEPSQGPVLNQAAWSLTRRRRPGNRARPHHAGGVRSHRRTPGAAVYRRLATWQDLLDRLPTATSALPKIAIFRDWLLGEAAKDTRQLQKPVTKAVKRRAD